VVDLANLDFMTREVATDGANAKDRDLGVIGNDDGEPEVGDVLVGDKIGAVGEDIAGGAGVDANPI
jgi:hypothetical protein